MSENTNKEDFKFYWNFESGEFIEPTNLEYDNINETFELELDYFDEKEQEDKLWMARTGLNKDTLCGAIETIIFMSDKPVSLAKIKNNIDEDLPLRVIHESISRLQEDYEKGHHGVRLMEVAQGYQFRTKATYSKFVQDLFKVNAITLSPTALEVLAMIAYKQPVSKTEIEKIRGVDSSHLIRGLMDKRLVKIAGRSEEAGRPSLLATTPEFLEVFNLNDLSELPPEHELDDIASGNAFGKISDIKSIVSTGDKAKFDFDELAELDELSANIKDISSDTIFTSAINAENRRKKKEEDAETPKRSAFDILEDFVNLSETTEQNKIAATSETPMNVIEAKIIDLAHDTGLLNAPEIDDEYMESLDERIEELEAATEDAIEAHKLENLQELATKFAEDTDEQELVEELFGSEENLEEEAKALEAALDEAFDNLMGGNNDFSELKDEAAEENIDSNINALDETLAEVQNKAKDLDLDLDFLDGDVDA